MVYPELTIIVVGALCQGKGSMALLAITAIGCCCCFYNRIAGMPISYISRHYTQLSIRC
ncbi:MAG: hypothetical protein K9G11_00305 [Rickettsiaceae bacterium]|nr:hypothetical protein [Rickettsiaceae bacterium]